MGVRCGRAPVLLAPRLSSEAPALALQSFIEEGRDAEQKRPAAPTYAGLGWSRIAPHRAATRAPRLLLHGCAPPCRSLRAGCTARGQEGGAAVHQRTCRLHISLHPNLRSSRVSRYAMHLLLIKPCVTVLRHRVGARNLAE